jgi:[acyl-carrier-protein] S-malonyltransferase
MTATAVLFPGQGSHTDDMRETVERARPELAELARELVGDDPFARAAESTRFAQPAIYCASLAGYDRIGVTDVMAGHSLGEVAALAAAGALGVEDGLRLVALRGELMERAAAQAGGGAMLAVAMDLQRAKRLARAFGLSVANDNAPDQVVLSGEEKAIDAARAEARSLGVRAARLSVAGAFHSPAMESAVTDFASVLAAVEIVPPGVTVMSCVTAAPFGDVRGLLAAALTRPVRWRETLLALRRSGVTRFVETGPGKVLTGLVRRTLADVDAHSIEEAARV